MILIGVLRVIVTDFAAAGILAMLYKRGIVRHRWLGGILSVLVAFAGLGVQIFIGAWTSWKTLSSAASMLAMTFGLGFPVAILFVLPACPMFLRIIRFESSKPDSDIEAMSKP